MQKKPNARISSSMFQQSDLAGKIIAEGFEERFGPTLSVRNIPIYQKDGAQLGTLRALDLGAFTILQINAKSITDSNVLGSELQNLEDVFGWYIRSRSVEVELLRVLENPVTSRIQGNQVWLALSSLGIDTNSLGEK